MIRKASPEDAEQLVEIYNYYVETSTVTFEETFVSTSEFAKRIVEVLEKFPYFVYEEEGKILGYAYTGVFRTRIAYRFSSEASVYVHKDHFKKGIATKLYAVLLDEMKAIGLKSALGGITLPNKGSVVLHEKFGFKKVAHFEKVGYKFDQWLDVGFWQLMFD
jgi:phosphinothricin acetyltransferase